RRPGPPDPRPARERRGTSGRPAAHRLGRGRPARERALEAAARRRVPRPGGRRAGAPARALALGGAGCGARARRARPARPDDLTSRAGSEAPVEPVAAEFAVQPGVFVLGDLAGLLVEILELR